MAAAAPSPPARPFSTLHADTESLKDDLAGLQTTFDAILEQQPLTPAEEALKNTEALRLILRALELQKEWKACITAGVGADTDIARRAKCHTFQVLSAAAKCLTYAVTQPYVNQTQSVVNNSVWRDLAFWKSRDSFESWQIDALLDDGTTTRLEAAARAELAVLEKGARPDRRLRATLSNHTICTHLFALTAVTRDIMVLEGAQAEVEVAMGAIAEEGTLGRAKYGVLQVLQSLGEMATTQNLSSASRLWCAPDASSPALPTCAWTTLVQLRRKLSHPEWDWIARDLERYVQHTNFAPLRLELEYLRECFSTCLDKLRGVAGDMTSVLAYMGTATAAGATAATGPALPNISALEARLTRTTAPTAAQRTASGSYTTNEHFLQQIKAELELLRGCFAGLRGAEFIDAPSRANCVGVPVAALATPAWQALASGTRLTPAAGTGFRRMVSAWRRRSADDVSLVWDLPRYTFSHFDALLGADAAFDVAKQTVDPNAIFEACDRTLSDPAECDAFQSALERGGAQVELDVELAAKPWVERAAMLHLARAWKLFDPSKPAVSVHESVRDHVFKGLAPIEREELRAFRNFAAHGEEEIEAQGMRFVTGVVVHHVSTMLRIFKPHLTDLTWVATCDPAPAP